MKILLLGSSGQVGQAFQELANSDHWPLAWDLMTWDRAKADLSKIESWSVLLSQLQPSLIINAAAYTQVDKAESEPSLCETINAKAPEALAAYCKSAGIPLVHYSTDYVYEGIGTDPHVETEAHQPQSVYGRTKAQGDEAIVKSGCKYLIFRTSWVYSHQGKNFVKTMLKLGSERDVLKVVNDQVGSPSYAPDLAELTLDALMQAMEQDSDGEGFPSGVYHLCNSGFTTWYEFAKTILSKEYPLVKVEGIPTTEYPTPAKRPLNSRLSLAKLEEAFLIHPRSWKEALQDCLRKCSEKI